MVGCDVTRVLPTNSIFYYSSSKIFFFFLDNRQTKLLIRTLEYLTEEYLIR